MRICGGFKIGKMRAHKKDVLVEGLAVQMKLFPETPRGQARRYSLRQNTCEDRGNLLQKMRVRSDLLEWRDGTSDGELTQILSTFTVDHSPHGFDRCSC